VLKSPTGLIPAILRRSQWLAGRQAPCASGQQEDHANKQQDHIREMSDIGMGSKGSESSSPAVAPEIASASHSAAFDRQPRAARADLRAKAGFLAKRSRTRGGIRSPIGLPERTSSLLALDWLGPARTSLHGRAFSFHVRQGSNLSGKPFKGLPAQTGSTPWPRSGRAHGAGLWAEKNGGQGVAYIRRPPWPQAPQPALRAAAAAINERRAAGGCAGRLE
jgi:hypothetical protein